MSFSIKVLYFSMQRDEFVVWANLVKFMKSSGNTTATYVNFPYCFSVFPEPRAFETLVV